MVKGEVLLHSFTIVEGWQVRELLPRCAAIRTSSTTLPADPGNLMARFGDAGIERRRTVPAGDLRFPRGHDRRRELLRQAHAALRAGARRGIGGRATRTAAARSAGHLLIVASIVEKETALAQERRKIAGLYLHRLAIGMRLQADPTVIYGLGDRYDGSLHTEDLRTDGPYNTYTRAGLPPTPIALPGAASIRASANPEKTDAVYFVASGKGDGSHVFSATLAEQNAAVARYLARLRQRQAEGVEK